MIAGVAMVASVLGGMFGYLIGWGAFRQRSAGRFSNSTARTPISTAFATRYNEWGAWAVLIAGHHAVPLQGHHDPVGHRPGCNLPVFIVASIIARGLRFFVVAALLWKFGAPIRDFIERRLGLMFTLFMILLIGGFLGGEIPMTRATLILLAAGGSLAAAPWGLRVSAAGLCALQAVPLAALAAWRGDPDRRAGAVASDRLACRLLGALAALTTGGIGVYHTGVERGWW